MLKQLILKNWKSFDEAKLWLEPFNILIGRNAAGKTNCIEALVFLKTLVEEGLPQRRPGQNPRRFRGQIEQLFRQGTASLSLGLVWQDEQGQEFEYQLSLQLDRASLDEPMQLQGDSYYNLTAGGREIFDSIKIPNERKIPFLAPTGIAVDLSFQALRQHLKRFFVLNPKPEAMRAYAPLAQELLPDASNLAGVIAAFPKAERQALEQRLSDLFKQFPEQGIERIWVETVGLDDSDAMLYCEERLPSGPLYRVDARQMSDGSLRFLALVLSFLSLAPQSTLIIEDIDTGFHPSRAQFLVDLLQELCVERQVDLICTTHDTAFIKALKGLYPFVSIVYRDSETEASRIQNLDQLAQLPKLLARGDLGLLVERGDLERVLKPKSR